MGSGGMPEDKSAEVEQIRQSAAERAAERERQEAEKSAKGRAKARKRALQNAYASVNKYFAGQGVPMEGNVTWDDEVAQEIMNIYNGIAETDENPELAFQNAGARIFDNLSGQYANKKKVWLDQIFSPDYAEERITNTLDDPYLEAVRGEQRGEAERIIDNMIKRGVITGTGKDAALRELNRQDAGVKGRLNELGMNILASGRNDLSKLVNDAYSTAEGLRLGTKFDANTYKNKANQQYTDFIASLGDQIRAQAPTGLYDTSSMAAFAGAGSGAQNTAFDPKALAGIFDPNVDEDEEDENNIPAVNGMTIF